MKSSSVDDVGKSLTGYALAIINKVIAWARCRVWP
jgi:hypothetical protein